MNRMIAPAVLAMPALLVTACSSLPRTPHQASATQLKTMALASPDLPFGWATSPPSTDSSVTAPCPALTASASAQLPAQAETDFQQSEDGPFLQEILASGPARQVHTVWASIQTAAGQCATATSTEPATLLSETKSPFYGDESYALALTADRAGVTYSGDVVVVRKGRVFVEVTVFGAAGVSGVSASLVRQMVDKAVHKLG